ncbi:MAG TPA: hypothetical protein G4N98_08920 [Thermoflexia bacterium]|nr:hypothetical protein [Thermoflexia bacterium]
MRYLILVLLIGFSLLGCVGSPSPGIIAPTATFTPLVATATAPPATPTMSFTPTATPYSTPNPALAADTAKRGLARVLEIAGEADLVCLRHEDTDGDAEPEWLALIHQPAAGPRLSAFVLDGEEFYALPAAHPKPGEPDIGLGQYATCELEIRDINADGRPEVAIFGHAEQHETFLHVYVWERGEYRLLGAFRGTADIHFEDRDGDLAEEIIEGHLDTAAPSLAWEIIFTWDGQQTYGWTTDRWAWYYLERPHAYLTHKPSYAVISFYLAVDDRDLPGAYALLDTATQSTRPYAAWANGFASTLRVDTGAVHQLPGVGDENHARVATQVLAWDNEAGRVIARTWEVLWDVVRTAEGWRLTSSTMNLLLEEEMTYYPTGGKR